MTNDSTFGAPPERLRRLLMFGRDEFDEHELTTASWDFLNEEPGSQIGRYRLVRLIGEGGMGMVYLAEQEKPIKRHVALKIIKPGMDSKRVMARFETERQALALLDHPNIAHVYDAGTTEAGRPYFVMERVKGLSITEHCDRHKLTIEERLRLFQQVCEAVQHAHQKGIIHRDIKPSNILISTENDRSIPKIIDFGIAKALAQPLTERTVATEDSQLLGTPEYMSPEQADPASVDMDTRSDIYSLGVLLYVLLTGALPFDSDTLRTGGIDRIRQVIREIDPKTPSTRLMMLGDKATAIAQNRRTEIQTLARYLRKELEWIPLKAMRKERTERYRSASELADDIENYLKGDPLIAGPPTTSYRLRKFVRRHKGLVIGVAAVLVVSVIGTIVSMIFALGQARALAEVEAVCDLLQNDLIASVNPETSPGRKLTINSFLDVVSGSVEAKLRDMPIREASIRATLGWTYRMLGELKAAELHLERTLQIYQEHLGAEHAETLESMRLLGWIYCGQGRYRKAEQLWDKKLEISRRLFGEEHPMTLRSMNDLAIAYGNLGRYDEAEQLLSKGFEISRHVLGEKHQTTVFFMGNLGGVYRSQGRYDEAEQQILKYLEIHSRVWGEQHPYTLTFKNFLAAIYREQGRYDEAEALYLTALDIQGRVLGEQHPYTLWSMNGLARVYTDQAKYEQAEKLFVEVLEEFQKACGKEHPDTIDCMNGLAELYTAQHRFGEAESLLTRAVEISSRTLGDDHPWTLTSNYNLAILYEQQGDYEKAESLLHETVKGRRLKLGDTHPHTLESLNNLIDLYEAWNKPEQANEWRAKLAQIQDIEE